MVNLFRNRYRVVKDHYLGFEAQVRYWWCPFWIQIDDTNTYSTLERAIERAEIHKQVVVWKDT